MKSKISHMLSRQDPFIMLACCAAALFALIGIGYGLPLHLIGDEESLIGGALTMLIHHTFIPSLHPSYFELLYYPVLLPYAILIASAPVFIVRVALSGGSIIATQQYLMLHLAGIWIAARFVSVLSYVGLVGITYALASLLYTKRTARFSALLLATSFFGVNLSHWMRHWSTTTFIMYATFYVLLRSIMRRDIPRWLTGVLAAIGMGVTYVVAFGHLVAAGIVLAKRNLLGKEFFSFILINSVVFIIATSFIVSLNYQDLIHQFYSKDGTITATKSFVDGAATFASGVTSLAQHEPILIILALLGLILVRRYRRSAITIFAVCAMYIIALYLFYHMAPRYMYFCVPALALIAGSTCDWLVERYAFRGALFAYLCIAIALMFVLRFDWLLLQEDTRSLALHWMEEHAQASMIISSPNISAERTSASLAQEQSIASLDTVERYLLQHPSVGSPATALEYTNIHFWKDDSLDALSDYLDKVHPRYAILQYWNTDDLSGREYSLQAGSTLIAEFRQSAAPEAYDVPGDFYQPNWIFFTLQRLGPTVAIYELHYR